MEEIKEDILLKYKNGFIIIIKKSSKAPILLLEYLSIFNAGKNLLHKIINNDDNTLTIKLNLTKLEMIDCINYVKDNL